jgi:pimeloyl-ACP methyl ester carboxylesterase
VSGERPLRSRLKTAYLEIPDSPLRPGAGPATIYYREAGAGTPLLFLHGGWGYEVYPFDVPIAALRDRFRILIPDRSGYGRSSPISELPVDFHQRAAWETLSFLDALGIGRAFVWGHSDGAVIAALMGLFAAERFAGLILEAFHIGAKVGSHEWMRRVLAAPDSVGERSKAALARDHGEGWRKVVERNAGAWLAIGAAGGDLYGGRLRELAIPTLFLHGAGDPRTEPGELDAMRRALPQAEFRIIEGAGHSPHSEPSAAGKCARIAAEFLNR